MNRTFLLGAVVLVSMASAVQSKESTVPAATNIVDRSIAHHDPGGVWKTGRIRIDLETTFSSAFAEKHGSRNSTSVLTLSPAHEEFGYAKDNGEDRIEITLKRGESILTVNGSSEVSDEDRERLKPAEASVYRDYYEYLFGLPMKLKDPSAILDPEVRRVEFAGREVSQLKVTYDPEVGKNTWYFYFDLETSALVGCRFFTDESKNDGEYITFEGEVVDEASGLCLPKARAWYYNIDDSHLATDTITAIETL